MAIPVPGHAETTAAEDDDRFATEQQLTLADSDERLPWLESEDDYDQPGVDTGRVIAFAAVGLLAVTILLGSLYYFTRGASDAGAVADGSTIEAPDQPYKTRPEDPGGREVEGTGDTSFSVAEGKTVEGRIAGGDPLPAAEPEPSASETEASSPAAPSATPSGVGVQVGAYSTRTQAEAGWSQLVGRFEALQGRSHRVLEGVADSGTIYRLQAVTGSVAEAEALCRSLKAAGGDCQVKR
jgi:hypothetical protein